MWLQHGCQQADPQPTNALTQHAEGVSDHLAGEARAGFTDGRNARGRPNGTPYAKPTFKNLHNSIRRPESMPRNCAPECCTQSSIVPNVQPRTQVISPGPVANGFTQCKPPAEVPPVTPAAAYARYTSKSSLQQEHTPVEEAHSARTFPPVERMCVRARRQGPTTKNATTETSHASRSSSSSSQQAHDLLWICWEIPLSMWTEAVSISASRYGDTLSRQRRSKRYFMCSRDDDVML